ncbi:MAG: hypothetical protein PHV30_03740 [Candidatus Margulisbacteria bacterium]|nr:hypothetical protein [Candidatus Margulisiibacteriota bacterium]
MTKRIIKIMIITYVVIMLLLPLFYYLFERETSSVKITVGINLDQKILTIFGDPFALNDLLLDNQRLLIIQNNNTYTTDEIKINPAETHEVRIKDKENKEIQILFSLITNEFKKIEKIKVLSKFNVNMPRISINNTRQFVDENNTVDVEYSLIGENDVYIDFLYGKVPLNKKITKLAVFAAIKLKELAILTEKNLQKAAIYSWHLALVAGKVSWQALIHLKSSLASAYNHILKKDQSGTTHPDITFRENFDRNSFFAGETAQSLEFQLLNKDFLPITNKQVKIKLLISKKTGTQLAGASDAITDSNGNIKFFVKPGIKNGWFKLKIVAGKKSHTFEYYIYPGDPWVIKNMKESVIINAPIGKLIKNAFIMKVVDRYGNAVPGALVEFWEKNINDQVTAKYAEIKTNNDGWIKLDYRMADEAKRFFIIAVLKDSSSHITYTVQTQAKKPENIEIVGAEERQAIVGLPLKEPFVIKLKDTYENPVSDIQVVFVLRNDQGDDLDEKTIRTNMSGLASAKFSTPKAIGEYSVVIYVENKPELEAGISLLVLPGSAAKMKALSGTNQELEWDKTIDEPLRVKLFDANENPIPDVDIEWKKSPFLNWVEKDDKTDTDGIARAIVSARKTDLKEQYVIASAGKTKTVFKIKVKEPSKYQLYLLSSPVIKVFADQRLPEDIVFSLKDQYDHKLPNTKIEFEYTVTRRGINYQQNITSQTDKDGLVSINFTVSDQQDEINFKGKYYDGKVPIITWVKIDVIPEGISLLKVKPDIMISTVSKKVAKPFEIFVGDNNERPIANLNLDISPLNVPGKEKINPVRVKTNKKGFAYFYPEIEKTAGNYVYLIKLNTLTKVMTVNALADEPTEIKILEKGNNIYPVGNYVKNLKFTAYDKYHNIVTQGKFLYGVNKSKKILKHKFNQPAVFTDTGLGLCNFYIPEKAGRYYLYITDYKYKTKAFYQFKARGINIKAIELQEKMTVPPNFVVGMESKGILPFKVLDRFGNPIRKVKMSLDIFPLGSEKSVAGVDIITDGGGKGKFSILMPEKTGTYLAKIYPAEFKQSIERIITFNLLAKGVQSATVITGDNQLVKANTRLKTDLVMLARDSYGNPVSNAEIRWSYIVKANGEERFLTYTTKTDFNGLVTFNYIVDNEPGIREIKANYLQNKKWNFVTFYIKIIASAVDSLNKLGGDNQQVKGGEELRDVIAVKALDSKDGPVQNLPVSFVIKSQAADNQEKSNPLVYFTDEQGIARARLIAPFKKGNYQIEVYSQNKKVVYNLRVLATTEAIPAEKPEVIAITSPVKIEGKIQPPTSNTLPETKITKQELSEQMTSKIEISLNKRTFSFVSSDNVKLYTEGEPLQISIHNNNPRMNKLLFQINERKWKKQVILHAQGSTQIKIPPAYAPGYENLKIYKYLGVGVLSIKYKIKEFRINTYDSSKFSLTAQDDVQKNAEVYENVNFEYKIDTDESIENNILPVIFQVKNFSTGNEIISTDIKWQQTNHMQIFNYIFEKTGAYIVEFNSNFSKNKLSYYVNVQPSSIIVQKYQPAKDIGIDKMKSLISIPLSFRLTDAHTHLPLANEPVHWEVSKWPEKSFIQFAEKTQTDKTGLAQNTFVINNIPGKYQIRARRMSKINIPIEFEFNLNYYK